MELSCGMIARSLIRFGSIVQIINPRAQQLLEKIRSGEIPYPPMWQTVSLTLLDVEVG